MIRIINFILVLKFIYSIDYDYPFSIMENEYGTNQWSLNSLCYRSIEEEYIAIKFLILFDQCFKNKTTEPFDEARIKKESFEMMDGIREMFIKNFKLLFEWESRFDEENQAKTDCNDKTSTPVQALSNFNRAKDFYVIFVLDSDHSDKYSRFNSYRNNIVLIKHEQIIKELAHNIAHLMSYTDHETRGDLNNIMTEKTPPFPLNQFRFSVECKEVICNHLNKKLENFHYLTKSQFEEKESKRIEELNKKSENCFSYKKDEYLKSNVTLIYDFCFADVDNLNNYTEFTEKLMERSKNYFLDRFRIKLSVETIYDEKNEINTDCDNPTEPDVLKKEVENFAKMHKKSESKVIFIQKPHENLNTVTNLGYWDQSAFFERENDPVLLIASFQFNEIENKFVRTLGISFSVNYNMSDNDFFYNPFSQEPYSVSPEKLHSICSYLKRNKNSVYEEKEFIIDDIILNNNTLSNSFSREKPVCFLLFYVFIVIALLL